MAKVGFMKTWPHEDGLYDRLPFEAFMLFRTYILAAGFIEHSYMAPAADDPTLPGDFCFYCSSDGFDLDEDRPRYRMVLAPAEPGNYSLPPGQDPVVENFMPRNLYIVPETTQWDGAPPLPVCPMLHDLPPDYDFLHAVFLYQLGLNEMHNANAVYWLTQWLKAPDSNSPPDCDTVLSAVFDGRTGYGFISVQKGESDSLPIVSSWVFTRQRRLPVDVRPGVAAMFGIVVADEFYRPVSRQFFNDPDSDRYQYSDSNCWSPLFGDGDVSMSVESDGYIPLRMLAPIFASGVQRLPFLYAGELLDVMAAGDGFLDGEAPMPGWRVFRPDGQTPLAIPWPDTIEQE